MLPRIFSAASPTSDDEPHGDWLPPFHNPVEWGSDESPNSSLDSGVVKARDLELSENVDDRPFPRFRHRDSSTHMELFYDLFFVANLTVFTNVQEISDENSLKQYVGFFALLWFTWYQVSLYDIRFTSDSLFERVAKLVQLGIMIAIAVVGGLYEVGVPQTPAPRGYFDKIPPRLKDLTLALMASRFMLFLQYLQLLYFSWNWKDSRVPVLTMASTYFISGWIYFGLYWIPIPQVGQIDHIYIAWYIVGPVESLIAIGIPAIWKQIGFKRSHMTERMSLLTLIILGEGVIGLAEEVQSIARGQLDSYSPPIVGGIVSAILILYFLSALYFDWLPEKSTGTKIEQIWSSLHFPLHVAFVLAVEGIRRNLAWLGATVVGNEQVGYINQYNNTLYSNSTASEFQTAARHLSNWVVLPVVGATLTAATSTNASIDAFENWNSLNKTTAIIANGSSDFDAYRNAIFALEGFVIELIYQAAGFELAAGDATCDAELTGQQYAQMLLDKAAEQVDCIVLPYDLTFIYFFVTTGAAVILCAILASVSSNRRKGFRGWQRIIATSVLGLALCLLATIAANLTNFLKFALSAWILPTVALVLFAVFLINVSQVSGGKARERGRTPDVSTDKA